MKKKSAKKVTELTGDQLDRASGGASGWRRLPPRPRKPVGSRPK
jgi:hypothetical protein